MSVRADDRLIGFHLGGAGAALPLALVREVTDRPRVVRQVFEETHWGIDMNFSLDADRERSLGWSGSDHACGSN